MRSTDSLQVVGGGVLFPPLILAVPQLLGTQGLTTDTEDKGPAEATGWA